MRYLSFLLPDNSSDCIRRGLNPRPPGRSLALCPTELRTHIAQGSLCLCRVIPAFDFLLACIIRQSPGLGNNKTRPGGLLRESHPSEDLSELPPLRDPADRGAVAGQGYHCGRMRSWRNRLPRLLLSGWIHARHLVGRRLCGNPHRWSWRIRHTLSHPLMLFCCRIFSFGSGLAAGNFSVNGASGFYMVLGGRICSPLRTSYRL